MCARQDHAAAFCRRAVVLRESERREGGLLMGEECGMQLRVCDQVQSCFLNLSLSLFWVIELWSARREGLEVSTVPNEITDTTVTTRHTRIQQTNTGRVYSSVRHTPLVGFSGTLFVTAGVVLASVSC